MKKLMISALLLIAGLSLSAQDDKAEELRSELKAKLAEMEATTEGWAREMEQHLKGLREDELSDEEIERRTEAMEAQAEAYEEKMERYSREIERWVEKQEPYYQELSKDWEKWEKEHSEDWEEFGRQMESWGRRFSDEMSRWAKDFSERFEKEMAEPPMPPADESK